jgi:hypothetical protein
MSPKNTTAAGYGNAHQKRRKRVAALVASGMAVCWRCGRRIPPGSLWDLGHDDWDRRIYRGPEHRYCNRSAGARKKQAMLRGDKVMINNKRTTVIMINKTVTDRW